ARLLDPGGTMETLPIRLYAVRPDLFMAPRAADITLQTDMVEGCGGLSEAVYPFTRRQVARGGDKEPDLHRGRQCSQVCRADLGPLRAVTGLIAGKRFARAGQPEPARRFRGGAARSAGHVLGEVVLHPHAMVAREHHCRVGRPRFGALFDDDPGLRPRDDA